MEIATRGIDCKPPIPVFQCNNNHFLWRKEDVQAMREESLVVPLAGSLPRSTRQNNVFGLPGLLDENQVATLRHHCVGDVKSLVVNRHVTESACSQFQMLRKRCTKVQAEEMMEVRRRQTAEGVERYAMRTGNGDTEESDSKRHRVAIPAQPSEEMAGVELSHTPVSEVDVAEQDSITVQTTETTVASVEAAVPHQPTIRTSIEDHYPLTDAALFLYPQTEAQCQRWMVFQHLHNLGFFLSSGLNFGADFIIYKGDPLLVHSCIIVLVVAYNQRLPLTQLVAAGRLACTAKKTVLLASLMPDSSQGVRLMTFQWSGIS